ARRDRGRGPRRPRRRRRRRIDRSGGRDRAARRRRRAARRLPPGAGGGEGRLDARRAARPPVRVPERRGAARRPARPLGAARANGGLHARLDDLARPDVRAAAADAEHGAVVCPGVAASVAASNVGYPSSLGGAVAVSFDCDRDCVYLVTLDRADGKPVVARRGAVAGGRTTSVTLPKAKLAGGTYRVDVRLVARVNPGAVT